MSGAARHSDYGNLKAMNANWSLRPHTPLFFGASIFLALILLAVIFLKSMLSDCSFIGSNACGTDLQNRAELRESIEKIKREIAGVHRKISKIECKDERFYEEKEPKIDAPLWNEGNLDALDGCWDLAWDYSLIRQSDSRKMKVLSWGMCFNNNADLGQQTIEFDDGTACRNQPIKAEFLKEDDKTKLQLSDTRHVQCTNNGQIIERKALCELSADALHADCKIVHVNENGTWPPYGEKIDVKLEKRKR